MFEFSPKISSFQGTLHCYEQKPIFRWKYYKWNFIPFQDIITQYLKSSAISSRVKIARHMGKQGANEEDEHLIRALTRLLRPLVRYLVSRGFTYVRLIQIIRPLYVNLVEQEYGKDRKPLSDSRISVLTGLARRYVKELRQQPLPSDPATLKASPNTKLIAEWITNPRFLDKRGAPRKLDRISEGNDPADFEELANIASSDVRPRTLLDDLIDKGMVEVTASGKLELLSNAYKPDKHINELIDYFGQHIHDHLAAATNNLQTNKAPFFERSAFQEGLTSESIETLKKFTDDSAMEMLKSVYAKAAALADADQDRQDNTYRFRLGAYCYSEDEGDNDDQDANQDRPKNIKKKG